MKTLITLSRFVAFSIDDNAQVSCDATVQGGQSPTTKEPITEKAVVSAPLPKDRSNDAILAAFQDKYAEDTVQWAAKPEVKADAAEVDA